MDTPGLRAVIQQLKGTNSKENAYLGFFYNDNNYETCYIKANKEGLELYAAKLLEASLDMDYRLFNNNKKEVFNFPSESFISESDFQFSFIHLLHKTKAEIKPATEYKKSWRNKLANYIVLSCLVFAIIFIIIGLISVGMWLF